MSDYQAMDAGQRDALARIHRRACVALEARLVWLHHAIQHAKDQGRYIGEPYEFTGDVRTSADALEWAESEIAKIAERLLAV